MNSPGLRRLAGLGLTAVLLAGASACDAGSPAPAPDPSATVKSYEKSVAGVVEASKVFLDVLDDDSRAEAQLEFTEENAVAWSDLPCGATCRPGVRLGDLDAAQLAAAKSVLKTALGSEKDTGYERIEEVLLTDDHLVAPQPGPSAGAPSAAGGSSGYGSGSYFLAFLGEPTVDGTWQLKFNGHDLAVHITYEVGKVAGASPFFVGAEPARWTAEGTTHEPLADMKKALLAMTGKLNGAQKGKARLARRFTDVVVGAQADGQYPARKEGLAVSSLNAAQQDLVLAAIKPWTSGADDATAGLLQLDYESELKGTYIAWSGTPGLTTPGDYVRIDGPSVWVEFLCEEGLVLPEEIRYRTIYRDRTRDYGGDLPFS